MAYKLFIWHIVALTYAIVLARASRTSALAPKSPCWAICKPSNLGGPY